MKRSSTTDAPTLFDLPPERRAPELDPEEGPESPVESLDLFVDPPAEEPPSAAATAGRVARARRSLPVARLAAGLVDLGVVAVVLGVIVGGTALMGVPPSAGWWPALALVALVFSFLYFTVPLAFWGQTPGMARRDLVARNESGGPLTFGQTFLRWLAALVTFALAGLPAALLLTGRSLADRLSGSQTRFDPRSD
ncbi:MAG: RDD family protein [Thermoanaerobaculia bacterium]|nr:RDD family protein [Thermoanaerobaculia bacterium]